MKNSLVTFVEEMAGNFWQSSHSSQWILDRVDLLRERQNDLQALASQGDTSAGTSGAQGEWKILDGPLVQLEE